MSRLENRPFPGVDRNRPECAGCVAARARSAALAEVGGDQEPMLGTPFLPLDEWRSAWSLPNESLPLVT